MIRNENICEYTDRLKKQKLNAVPGTLKLHQVVAAKNSPGVIQYCDISCNCSFNSKCCHDGGRTTFVFALEEEDGNIHKGKNNCKSNIRRGSKKQKIMTNTIPMPPPGAVKETTTEESIPTDPGENLENIIEHSVLDSESSSYKGTEKANDRKHRKQIQEMKAKLPKQKSEVKFENYLQKLQKCKTFNSLKRSCKQLKLNNISGHQRSIINDCLAVDDLAIDNLTEDMPAELYPAEVKSDGNCLSSLWQCICLWKS